MPETLIVFSCKQESEELCLNELLKAGWNLRFNRWIDHGVGVLSYKGTFAEFATLVKEKQPIFLLHIFPIEYTLSWDAQIESKDALIPVLEEIASGMRLDEVFSVQLRKTPNAGNESDLSLKKVIQQFFEEAGFQLHVRQPKQVISVYCTADQLYIGLSDASQNLSDWSGGMSAYAFREDTISRSEFKLLEAIDYFALRLPVGGVALDLGAAPGGWTKALLEKGMRVIAVDPGELSPVLLHSPDVQHYKGLAQDFLRQNHTPIDLLVNDMRMDVFESVKITNDMASCLKQGGLVIITFKLPSSKKTTIITKGANLLREKFTILHMKQLYHNRSEITVIARKDIV